MKNIQSIFSYNKCIVVVLLVLVMPILCSTDKKSHSIKRSKNFVSSNHLNAIHSKENPVFIVPQHPYHFSGSDYLDGKVHTIVLLDSTINVIRRSKDYYYKWVFTYTEEKNNDNTLALKTVTIDEEKSKFLLSSRDGESQCSDNKAVEISYKTLSAECKEKREIKEIVSNIRAASKLSCQEEEGRGGAKRLYCEMQLEKSLEEINYKLDNLNMKTYPTLSECQIGDENSYMIFKENRIVLVDYDEESFKFLNKTVENNENYTKVGSNYYLCLTSDCKYICEEYNFNGHWSLYDSPCYGYVSDFNGFFNKAFNKVYTAAKNYNPTQNNLRRSLLEEKEEEEEKNNKKVKAETKGYYKEDVQEGRGGHYKGYFLIGKKLTLIKQSNINIKELKLVLNLDESNSVKIDNFDDEGIEDLIDHESSGFEPRYSSAECKSFISFKTLQTEGPKCGLQYDDNYIRDYLYREYNITGSGDNTKLTIVNIYNDQDKEEVPLTEYSDSAELGTILSKITSYTNPIPDDKCLNYNKTEANRNVKLSLHNKVIYQQSYEKNGDSYQQYSFNVDNEISNDQDYTSMGDVYFAKFGDKYIANENQYFYHNYVDFEGGNDYVVCEEKLKNDALQEFSDRIDEIKSKIGIDDGSVEYMMNIFLISFLLIIFI